MFLFGEHIQASPADLAGIALALALLLGGVVTLSHSQLVQGETDPVPPAIRQPSYLDGWTNS